MTNCEVLGTLLLVHMLHVQNYTCAPLCKLSLDTILKGETGLWSNCLMTNDKIMHKHMQMVLTYLHTRSLNLSLSITVTTKCLCMCQKTINCAQSHHSQHFNRCIIITFTVEAKKKLSKLFYQLSQLFNSTVPLELLNVVVLQAGAKLFFSR